MSKKLEHLFENFMISEGRVPGTPSIKRYKRPDGTTALKSLNKWGKRKDWRDTEGGLAKAREHAGVDEVTEGLKDPEDNPCWKGYKPVGTKKKNSKTVPNCVPVSEEVPCAEPISNDPNDPTSRLIGTDSIVRVYKNATPGQGDVRTKAYKLASAILAERAPAPRTPTPAPVPRKPGVLTKVGSGVGRVAGYGLQASAMNDDMTRKREQGKQTYGQAVGTTAAAAAGGIGGWEAGWRAGMKAPGKLKVVTAPLGAVVGSIIGHDAIDAVGEKIFHKESIDLNESFEMAFDYQGKPQLAPTAGELMMQAKGAFAYHTDVQNVMDVKAIKESIQKQFELTVLEEDTEQLASKCEVLMDMVEHALDTIATIKESTTEKDAWAEAQILKLESYILSVSKYIDNILGEDLVPVIRRSYMRTDPRTGQRKRVKGRAYKRRRDFTDDEDDKQDMPKGPLSV